MPLIRKVIQFGKTSRGIILPKSWLELLERKHGKIEAVSMEVNGKLTIRPVLRRSKRECVKAQSAATTQPCTHKNS